MDSFIHAAGWSQSYLPTPASRPTKHVSVDESRPRLPLTQVKSLSSVPTVTSSDALASSPTSLDSQSHFTTPEKPRRPTKSPSTSVLPRVSATYDDELSTLPDPRHRIMSPSNGSPLASPVHHPDLSEEVAALSTKLINAINHQTTLDDTLSATRHELEAARTRIQELEATNASQRETLSGDVWVRRSTVELEKKELKLKSNAERMKRLETEKENKRIEQELESLSTALFEEANRMVVQAKEDAKADYDALLRKNEQIKGQLADSENLLKSQQEQLSQLKHVMETMTSERDDQTTGTAPSSPGFARFDPREVERSIPDGAPPPLAEALSPTHPTAFHHLIQPVLRHDIGAFDDFVGLARLSRHRDTARVSSGSLGGLGGLSLVGLGGYTASNASMTSLHNGGASGSNSAPQSPNTAGPNGSPSTASGPVTHLKDTRFYRRVLAEDIEPTLRLDAAPALSWLARRSVLTAVSEGALVVEPVAHSPYAHITKPQYNPCALCGENRRDQGHLRNHRFRVSESDNAQRYPLCPYCLGRVRSTCDFLGFLRIVKDGHWRADDDDQEKSAWEESVRLREQMFWSRIGGGVVPANQFAPTDLAVSPRASHEGSQIEAATNLTVPANQTKAGKPSEKALSAAPVEEEHLDSGKDGFKTPPERTDVPTIETSPPPPVNDKDEQGATVDAGADIEQGQAAVAEEALAHKEKAITDETHFPAEKNGPVDDSETSPAKDEVRAEATLDETSDETKQAGTSGEKAAHTGNDNRGDDSVEAQETTADHPKNARLSLTIPTTTQS